MIDVMTEIIDIKNFPDHEVSDSDTLLMTDAKSGYGAGSATVRDFKEKVLKPFVEKLGLYPGRLEYAVLTFDDYEALAKKEANTLYVIKNGNDVQIVYLGSTVLVDGKTVFRLVDNCMQVSFDGGSTHEYVVDENGHRVSLRGAPFVYEDFTSEQIQGLKPRLNDFTSEEIAELQQPARDMIGELESTNENMLTAEEERVKNEQGRTSAESGRVTRENDRIASESARKSTEQTRVTAESGRSAAESTRVNAESSRQTTETGRVASETERGKSEDSRKTSENNRVIAENNRVTVENARVIAETARKTAETTRVNSESTREVDESARVSS